jgi:ATP-dependent RNA helicase DDX3X
MTDNFDTTEMSTALEAISGATRKQPIGAPPSKEEAIAKARGHKWVEPQKYDYSIYNKQVADAGTDTSQSRQHEWASSAGKYEWNDEYGDVGPRVPELEKQLFNDELRMRHGDNFNAFQFQVLVEGPVKPDPVMRVSPRSLRF